MPLQTAEDSNPVELEKQWSTLVVDSIDPRKKISVRLPAVNPAAAETAVTMMRNFSAVLPELLVGSTPLNATHILALEQVYNVGLVVTLTEEQPLPPDWFHSSNIDGLADRAKWFAPSGQSAGKHVARSKKSPAALAADTCWVIEGSAGTTGARFVQVSTATDPRVTPQQSPSQKPSFVRNLFVPVPNYYPPSADELDAILQEIERIVCREGRRVFVHCGGGKGRAGTVAACTLLRYGL